MYSTNIQPRKKLKPVFSCNISCRSDILFELLQSPCLHLQIPVVHIPSISMLIVCSLCHLFEHPLLLHHKSPPYSQQSGIKGRRKLSHHPPAWSPSTALEEAVNFCKNIDSASCCNASSSCPPPPHSYSAVRRSFPKHSASSSRTVISRSTTTPQTWVMVLKSYSDIQVNLKIWISFL